MANRESVVAAPMMGLSLFVLLVSRTTHAEDPDPKALVAKVVAEAGGVEGLRAKRDVEYVYLHRAPDGRTDLSVERYLFDGEKSWARYDTHEYNVHPGTDDTVIQGYDGQTSWETVDGKRTTDAQASKVADFLRKTNFYWFAMVYKLLDPGTNHRYAGQRKVADTTYELVELTFGQGVGDVADTYLLYINPETWRIDRFLFTVLDFGRSEPLMMEVDYDRVDGLLIPTKRRYAPANWSGRVKGKEWTDEISVGVRFDNGFGPNLFAAP